MPFGVAIKTALKTSAKHIAGSRVGQYFGGGVKGLKKVANYGVSSGLGYYFYSDTLGTGGAILYGVAGAIPVIGQIIIAGELGHMALQYGNQVYKQNRRVEFGRPIEDRFETMQQMRMHSIQQLSRSRASIARFVGNEAWYYHNR